MTFKGTFAEMWFQAALVLLLAVPIAMAVCILAVFGIAALPIALIVHVARGQSLVKVDEVKPSDPMMMLVHENRARSRLDIN